jgi:hypothetical protein
MTTLQSSLRNYSPAMLRAIAEANGIELASNQTSQMVEQLAALLHDADHVRASLAACTPAAQQALADLLRDRGPQPAPGLRAQSRRHPASRPGPAGARAPAPDAGQPDRRAVVPRPAAFGHGRDGGWPDGVPVRAAGAGLAAAAPPPVEQVFPPAPLPAVGAPGRGRRGWLGQRPA